jgi:hypothetical protein
MGLPGIPKYGANFRLERLPYDSWARENLTYNASRRYVLKRDPSWFIQASRDSKSWHIFVAGPAGAAYPAGRPHRTLRDAMAKLLDGIAQGFYPTAA